MQPETTPFTTRALQALRSGRRWRVAGAGGAAAGIAAVAAFGASHGTPTAPPVPIAGVLHDVEATAPTPTPTPSPTPAPTPLPTPEPTTAPVPAGHSLAEPPSYPLVDYLDAPSVGVHVPVVAVGVVHGAMDAPEGPLGSPFWREGFWLRESAQPGTPGTATIAGHLDDTAGRPAAFWNIRNVRSGDEVSVTRAADGAVFRYRIVETDVWTLSQANTSANLQRIYGNGSSADGVGHLTLITCTGHWNGYEYDHRFVAFATLES